MPPAFRVYADGQEISDWLRPGSLVLERDWGANGSMAEFVVAHRRGEASYYSTPSSLGALAWLHLEEASGNALDSSGNGRDFTVTGSPFRGEVGLPPSYGGLSYRFKSDGSAYLSSNDAAFNFAADWSVWFWVRIPSGLSPVTIMSRQDALPEGWTIGIGAGYFRYRDDGHGSTYNLAQLGHADWMSPGTHFIAMTIDFDAGPGQWTGKLYVDNVLRLTQASLTGYARSTKNLPSANLVIGADPLASNHFNGRLDEIGLVNRVLTTQEIADLWNQGQLASGLGNVQDRATVLITTSDNKARFGGYAALVNPKSGGAVEADQHIAVTPWERRFQSIRITYRGFNKRTDEILTEILADPANDRLIHGSTMLSDLTTNGIKRGRQVDAYLRSDVRLSDVFDELAAYDQFFWRFKYDGSGIIYRPISMVKKRNWYITDDPAVIVSDSKARAARGELDYKRENLDPVSYVIVKGGSQLTPAPFAGWWMDSKNINNSQDAGGVKILEFDLVPEEGEDQIRIEINDGDGPTPIWAPLTVEAFADPTLSGLKMNGGTADALWNPKNRTIYFDEDATPRRIEGNLSWASWRIFAQKKTSIRATVHDGRASQRLGGRYDDVIVDASIMSADAAKRRAGQHISEGSKPRESAFFLLRSEIDDSSDGTPLEVGDLLHLVNRKRTVDTRLNGDGLQVQRIISRPLGAGGQMSIHEIYLGYWPKNLLAQQYEQLKAQERVIIDDFFEEEETIKFLDFGFDGDPQDIDGVVHVVDAVWNIVRV